MPDETAPKTDRRPILRALFNRRWKKIVAGIIVLVVAALILIPYAIEYGVERLILANGGDAADIEDIDFNPFTGRLALTGLDVTVGGEKHLKISEAEVRLRWWPLFKKRIEAKGIFLSDTEVSIEDLMEGRWRLGGIVATLLAGSEEEKPSSSPWGIGLRTVSIRNTRINFSMPNFRSTLQVDKWDIERALSWQPEELAKVTFSGRLNGSPLQYSGEVTPFADDRRGTFKLKAEALDLKPFEKLFGQTVSAIEGAISMDADLKMDQKADGALSVTHNGSIQLANARFKTPDLETSNADLTYSGNLDVSISPAGDMKLDADGQLSGNQLKLRKENLETGLTSLKWQGLVGFTREKTDSRINTKGALEAEGMSATVGGDQFTEDKLEWDGALEAEIKTDSGIQAQAEGNFESRRITAKLPGKNLNAGHAGFFWKGKLQARQAAEKTDIQFDGEFSLQNAEVTSAQFNLTEDGLKWTGSLICGLPKNKRGITVLTDGRLDGGPAKFQMPASSVGATQQKLVWEGKLAYTQEENTDTIDLNGKLDLDSVTYDSPIAQAAEQQIEWNGVLQTYFAQSSEKPGLMLDGTLNLGKLELKLPDNQLAVDQESLNWEGPLAYGEVPRPVDTTGKARLRLQNLRVADIKGSTLFLAAGEVSAEALQLAGPAGVRGNTLEISALEVIKPQQTGAKNSLLGAKSVSVQEFEVDPSTRVRFKTITVDSLKSLLVRKADGSWSFAESLALLSQPGKTGQAGTQKVQAAKKPQPQFALDRLVVKGDSWLQFEDKSVTPAFSTRMVLSTLSLSNLDSSRAGQKSPYKLAGKIGKYTDVNFDGALQPFADRLSMKLEGRIDDLELPPLSPYIVTAIGYKFASGQCDADIDMTINNGEMDGKTQFVFQQIRAKAADAETLKKLNIQQTIPMETALSLLRDNDGTIKLKVPISGDIANPQFSVGDAINQALLKATTQATMGYLKYALGPYGIAIAAAEVAYMAATKAGGIRLEPLGFPAGQASLDPAGRDYVDRLAKILKDRPEAKIRVCGLAAETADRAALQAQAQAAAKSAAGTPPAEEAEKKVAAMQAAGSPQTGEIVSAEQLEAIAAARSDAIKDVLVSQYGIEDDRVLICHPEIDKTPAGTPRAEILF